MLAFLPVSTAVSVAAGLMTAVSAEQVSRDWRQTAWKLFVLVSLYNISAWNWDFFIQTLGENVLRRDLDAFFGTLFFYPCFMGPRDFSRVTCGVA
jgi:hypothetical protein